MSLPLPSPRRPATGARTLLAISVVLGGCACLGTLVDLPVARWIADRTANPSGAMQRSREPRRLPGDIIRLLNLSEVFGYSPSAGIILLAAMLLDPSLARMGNDSSRRRIHSAAAESASAAKESAGNRALDGRGSCGGWRVPVSLSADALRMLAITFSGGLTTDLIKLMVTRVRPYAADLALHGSVADTFSNVGGVEGVAVRSFPSGHAAVAAGLASALCWRYPRGTPLFISLAVAAALQRLTSSSHYVSDVATGAAIATAWAAFWLWSAERANPG